MTIRKLMFGSLALAAVIVTADSKADTLKPIEKGGKQEAAADAAQNINSVQTFKIGTKELQLVSLESKLNGDLNATTMLLVGEKGVGGLVGYDSAFLLGPTETRSVLSKARQVGNDLQLSFLTLDGKMRTFKTTYDVASGSLKIGDQTLKKVEDEGVLEVANQANDAFAAYNITIGKTAYKIVSLESGLNGDLNSTTMVLVGAGGVGGEAGYDQAFQLGPDAEHSSLTSARRIGHEIEVTFSNIDGGPTKFLIRYDVASKTLIERQSK